MAFWIGNLRRVAVALAGALLLFSSAPAAGSDLVVGDWGLEAVGAQAAWDLTAAMTPSRTVVAVLDTGVDKDHPRLREVLEQGWSLVGGEPVKGAPDDSADGHGTHVAGLIQQVAGPVPVRILPVKVLESDGSGSISDLAAAIRFAVDWRGPAGERVAVINLSLGFRLHEAPVELAEAVRYALAADLILVAAAGNESRTLFGYYPAALNGVVAVGAAGPDGKSAQDSNAGAHILAPGVEVVSALPGGGEGARTGSSFAAPFVSAGAAIVRSLHPGMSRAEVVNSLLSAPYRLDSALRRAAEAAAPRLVQPERPFNRPTLSVEGHASPGSAVLIEMARPGSVQSAEVGRGTADSQGRLMIQVALPADESTFFLTAVSLRGDERSRPSAAIAVSLDFTPPDPPSGLEAESRWRGRTHLSWQPSPSGDLAGYRLTRLGGPYVMTRGHRFTFDSPQGRFHEFDLVAVDRAGNGSRPLRIRVFVPPNRPWTY